MTIITDEAMAKADEIIGTKAFRQDIQKNVACHIQQMSDAVKQLTQLKVEYARLSNEHNRQRNAPSRGYDEEAVLARMEDLTEKMDACLAPHTLPEPPSPLAKIFQGYIGHTIADNERFAETIQGYLTSQGYKIVKEND